MTHNSLTNLKIFTGILLSSSVLTVPNIVKAQEIYHPGPIPIGTYTFYEKSLKKNVAYVRSNNEVIGALYSSAKPNIFTCFQGKIKPNTIEVIWWRNLEQIGQTQKDNYQRIYTIQDFTVDNVNLESGIGNPNAVKTCTQYVVDNK